MNNWRNIVVSLILGLWFSVLTANAQVSVVNLDGNAKDIGIAANGTVWTIGNQAAPGGFNIQKWTGSSFESLALDMGAKRIAVDANGNPLVISESGIHYWQNNTWQTLPGYGIDIGVGADGSIWTIGGSNPNTNNAIFHWNHATQKWDQVAGAAVRIAVDPNGNPWVLNAAGDIFERVNNNWKLMPGKAEDIGIGADGTVWVIGYDGDVNTDGFLFGWNGADWIKFDAQGHDLAVDQHGLPWFINSSGSIATLAVDQIIKASKETSIDGGIPVLLSFINNTQTDLKIIWVDFDGLEHEYDNSLEPAKEFLQASYAGHLWRIYQNNILIGSYRATNQAVQRIVVTGSSTLALQQTPFFSRTKQAAYSDLGLINFINFFRPEQL